MAYRTRMEPGYVDWNLVNTGQLELAANEAWKVANMLNASRNQYMKSISELNNLLLDRDDYERSAVPNRSTLLLENALRIKIVFQKINEIRTTRTQNIRVCTDFENQFHRGTQEMLRKSQRIVLNTLARGSRARPEIEEWHRDIL